jgi:hypothetical protein
MSRYDPTLRETRTCRYCKKRFKFYLTLARNNSKNPGKYCSRECSDKDSRVTLKCAHCKKRFTTWACMAKKRKYCSHECAGVARNRKPRTCIHCGKQYMAARVEALTRKYCSFSCKVKYEGFHRRKPMADPDGNRGLTRLSWRALRLQILKRDRFRCTQCGARDKQLTIHHTTKWDDCHSNDPSILVTVCRSCHMRIEKFA